MPQHMDLKFKLQIDSPEQLSSQKIYEFLQDYREGNLWQDFKSEPVPAFLTPRMQVREIVGLKWYETIHDDSMDVFVAYIS